MPRKPSRELTPNEWKIMEIVWQLKSCAASDVCAIAAERHGWAPTTVKTYLSLLVTKERLSAKKIGNSFLYKPKVTMLQTFRRAADGLMEKTFKGAGGPLLAYMIRQSSLSKEDIAELRKALDEMSGKGGRP